MLNDLHRSLDLLLRRELPSDLSEVTITFATPDQEFPPPSVRLPAIDFFLYDVRENLELRSKEWRIERAADGTARRHKAATRVACSYLVTAWSAEGSPSRAEDEHHLLGEVLQVLLRFPVLPGTLLQGSLAAQEPPLPAFALLPEGDGNAGQFWFAMGRPKATLHYRVTVAVESQEPVPVDSPLVGMGSTVGGAL